MAQSIIVTQKIRQFTRLLYTETAASIQLLFENNLLPETFGLQKVRVCCGSETENITNNGSNISEQSPWLAELYFGNTSENEMGANTLYSDYFNSKIGIMSCTSVQGIGKVWQTRLRKHNLKTIEDLARCPIAKTKLICDEAKSLKMLEFVGKAKIAVTNCPTMPLCPASDYQVFTIPFLESVNVLENNPELIESNWITVQSYIHKLIAVLDDKVLKGMKIADVL